MPEIFTAQEAADRLKVHINTLYRWIDSGLLKASKVGDLWRVSQDDLDEFLEAGKATGKGV